MPSGLRVEMLQHAMKMAGAVFEGGRAEAFAKSFGALREIGEPFEERAEIETGADGNNGKAFAGAKIGEGGEGAFAVITGGGRLGRIEDVEKMMRNGGTFRRRWLGGADVEAAVELG